MNFYGPLSEKKCMRVSNSFRKISTNGSIFTTMSGPIEVTVTWEEGQLTQWDNGWITLRIQEAASRPNSLADGHFNENYE